jgi:putative transposase
VRLPRHSLSLWPLRVNGKLCYLWHAGDHEGEVLEAVVTSKRDKTAALKLLKRIMKKNGRPRKIVTDGLCSYSGAMKEIGAADRHGGRWPPQQSGGKFASAFSPTRARDAAVSECEDTTKFSSIHTQVHNHFNQERHLVTREVYKQRRSAALAEWRTVMA